MDAARFDALVASLSRGQPRRAIARRLGATALSLAGLTRTWDLALPRNRKKRRGRRRRRKRQNACKRACGAACTFCFHRPALLPSLCGDAFATPGCTALCESDADCTSSMFTICLTGFTTRATGKTERFAGCDYPIGICARIFDCATE